MDRIAQWLKKAKDWVLNPRSIPEGADMPGVRKDIMELAWPALVEQVLVSLVSMVDMMMVGKLGSYAIASVGLCTQPRFVLLSCFIALNVGTTALVARMKGAGDQEGANRVLRQSMMLTLVLSAVLSVVGAVFAPQLIQFMGAEADTLGPAVEYLRIQMYGFVFTAMGLCIAAALRGVGNTRMAMYMNVTANVVNVILNYCLIYGNLGFPKMGVPGASLATVIGTVVSYAMALAIVFRRKQYLAVHRHDSWKPHLETIRRIVKIGIPAMIEQLAMRVGLLIYTRTVSGLGTTVFATHQIALNILSLSFTTGMAFSTSATSLVGQSLGRKRKDMALLYASQVQRLGAMVALALAAVFLFLGGPLVSLYSDEAAVIAMGAQVLRIVALLQPFQCSTFILSGALRGAGDSRWPAISVFVGVLGIRPALSALMVTVLQCGLIGAWVALVVDQLVRLVIVYLRFRGRKWLDIKV
ncbi:MAG: MATE family efflux transporter [Eubacteriales bacterium]|nr:MATE family efflux transporter [Eubacteriales bacterium]